MQQMTTGQTPSFAGDKPIITLTERAAEQVRRLMGKAGSQVLGLRVGVKTAGCSGLQYEIEYASEQKPFEDRIEDKGVTLFIDPAAVMFLIGSEMDWAEDKFASSFVFANPNETARCGCGESFSVS
jgi:iron-sulfur cluster assembly protein